MDLSNLQLNACIEAGFNGTSIFRMIDFLKDHPEIHWLAINEETGLFELTLDNHMLSTFRNCPSHFMTAFVDGVQLRTGGRSWFLDFGILFHKMVEEYYTIFREPGFNILDWATTRAPEEWKAAEMNFHSAHKEYKVIGGVIGFTTLIISYALKFSPDNERLRVIGTEIGFGKGREVLLGIVRGFLSCFLSGRIDVLVDDGTHITPLDHKTMNSFRSDPAGKYEVDEGPTGYIYAVGKILPSLVPPEMILKRRCDRILMNFISKTPTEKPEDRFRRLPIYKTTEQLSSYQERMLLTGEDIFRSLLSYVQTGHAQRNTGMCNSWFMRDCPYLPIHRQGSKRDELLIIDSMYSAKPIWDTEMVGKES